MIFTTKLSRAAFPLVAGFLLGLVLASCSGTQMCTAATCGGCCDSTGKCQSGATADACGLNGASCGRCGTGTACQSGECRASTTGGGTGGGGGTTGGGTGGGTTGGGTTGGGTTGGGTTGGGTGGGTTGGGTGCAMIASAPAMQSNLITASYIAFSNSPGHYNLAVFGAAPLTTNVDLVRIEVVYPNDLGPVPPTTRNFTSVGYFTCPICSIYAQNCDMNGNCEKTYLAQSGSVTITRADRNAEQGRIAGSMSNVRFNEWDLSTDRAVTGGGCIQLGSVSPFDVYWSADGGIPP